ncbi:MAG: 16S rRNA (adenine(1518)-N(6)/adenine(1519)-N(6))-dimethyltransferase RsmA [Lachnospiraceae bacterium]|nr:16S rRNA (adenine(1518)-N(6)/adenine(1519)-N(6))-dimethyltransferase RsmA [Lachnospiraceae bacterium]
MANLADPKNTIEILNKYHIIFQKKYGQNFLIDEHVIRKILNAAGISKDDTVLEIGPGIGTLTQYLCESAGKVIAVEIDRNLVPILENDTLAAYDNVRIINDDVMRIDLKALIDTENGGKPIKVAANLPYYITTPIVMSLLEARLPIENITVMVQKEVAARMQAKPGTPDYGALSLAVQYYSEPYIAANVPVNCFMPRPGVDSAVIRMQLYKDPPVSVRDEKLMFAIIRASFNQRRKTLLNGICNSSELSFSKEQVTNAIREAGLPENVRGETLSLEQFALLSDNLKNADSNNI